MGKCGACPEWLCDPDGPDRPDRRWVHWSRDAWRWLGWHAPLPDGEHWMYHPMDAFRAAPICTGPDRLESPTEGDAP